MVQNSHQTALIHIMTKAVVRETGQPVYSQTISLHYIYRAPNKELAKQEAKRQLAEHKHTIKMF